MSRIFEALQQSEFERTGNVVPQSAALATELLRAAENSVEDTGEPFGQSRRVHSALAAQGRLVAVTNRCSLAAEKFRFLGVRLRQLQQQRPLKKVLVTSPLAEEGKSFVCANLAITLARKQEQRVLLLEGDLRRPVLADNLGLAFGSGLAESLERQQPATANVFYLEDLGFWFLPAGRPPENPSELMQPETLSGTLEQLNSSFDWIIIDSPPLLPLVDTNVWLRLVDGTLLVTRRGKTEKRQLKRALELVDKTSLLGAVVNSCSDTSHETYYQRYGFSASTDNEKV